MYASILVEIGVGHFAGYFKVRRRDLLKRTRNVLIEFDDQVRPSVYKCSPNHYNYILVSKISINSRVISI